MKLDYAVEIENRASWIRKILTDAKAKGIVLGLSGGKDCAAVAAICAYGGIPILGVHLSINSNPDDIRYIKALHKRLLEVYPGADFRLERLDLTSVFDEESRILCEVFDSFEADERARQLALANTKARLRMTTLYAIANRCNYLVAGTGNACEAYVGYFTKWGDGAHDFNPIGDLTVEEVIELGIAAGVPEICMRRVPSAGLWEGQTDEGEMGITYIDIAHVVRGDHEMVSDPEALEKIGIRHRASAHKRTLIPVYKRS